MAIYPCDWAHERYSQPQQSVYFTCVFEDKAETYKLRLCPRHFAEALEIAQEHLDFVPDDGLDQLRHCDHELDKKGTIFGKFFPSNEEPAYYAADLCVRCFVGVRQDLHISHGRLLSAR